MFAYLHYNGSEPGWAKALRETGYPCYSPALTLESQIPALSPEMAGLEPSLAAYEFAGAFGLDRSIWVPWEEALDTLCSADNLADTVGMVWRDQWLLTRSGVLIVENGATNEIPLLAKLWGIPTIGISFTPVGSHHWFSYCVKVVINSPENAEQILSVIGLQNSESTASDSISTSVKDASFDSPE